MIIVFARQLDHLCRNTQSWHKKKLLHSDLWMPTFVQQDLWKAVSAAGIAAAKRCFLLNGTYITETVPWAAPLRACGLPDAVFLAISATSACRDLHLEGEEGGGERRFSSTALPPVHEVADTVRSMFRSRAHGAVGGVECTGLLCSCAWPPVSTLLSTNVRGKVLLALFGTSGEVVPKRWGPTRGGSRQAKAPSPCSQHSQLGHRCCCLSHSQATTAQPRDVPRGHPRDCTEKAWRPPRDTGLKQLAWDTRQNLK